MLVPGKLNVRSQPQKSRLGASQTRSLRDEIQLVPTAGPRNPVTGIVERFEQGLGFLDRQIEQFGDTVDKRRPLRSAAQPCEEPRAHLWRWRHSGRARRQECQRVNGSCKLGGATGTAAHVALDGSSLRYA